jgi:hypothetical protein
MTFVGGRKIRDALGHARHLLVIEPRRQKPQLRHLGVGRIARHVDQRDVPTGVIEAGCDQVLHAKLAYVAERHRRTSGVLGFHSITSSARAKNIAGTVKPIALAVLRLMTSSNFVGNSTGKSPGLAPLRISTRSHQPRSADYPDRADGLR